MTLLSKLSALTGPDRCVDRAIADAIGKGPPETWERKVSIPGVMVYMDEGSWISPCGVFIHHSERYTASIDVAMTLVPEGWDWTVGVEDGEGWANVNPTAQPFPVEMDITETAANPAIALCIAALKGRNLP